MTALDPVAPSDDGGYAKHSGSFVGPGMEASAGCALAAGRAAAGLRAGCPAGLAADHQAAHPLHGKDGRAYFSRDIYHRVRPVAEHLTYAIVRLEEQRAFILTYRKPPEDLWLSVEYCQFRLCRERG